jgi:hypothetical protein
MAITAQILKSDGPGSAGGTVLGTQTIAAPVNWTRLTNLDNMIPAGGAFLKILSDAEAFRWQTVDPVSSQDTAQADRPPRDNGVYEPSWGTGSETTDYVHKGTQVWVKQA